MTRQPQYPTARAPGHLDSTNRPRQPGVVTSLPPADWHEDPNDPTQWRYWDGQQWTNHTAPRDAAAGVQVEAQHPGAVRGQFGNSAFNVPSHDSVGRYPEPPRPIRSGVGASKKALEAANAQLHAYIDSFGFTERNAIANDIQRLQAERTAVLSALHTEQRMLEEARHHLAVARDDMILQEVGIYDYHHPLEDSVQYASALKNLRDRVKLMSRPNGGAVTATTDWQVNGSPAEGARMVREFSKLLLRAYNTEADGLVSTMKPYKLSTSTDRLQKSRDTISKLGQSMSISITPSYHELRIEELRLTADYLQKKAEEREREREERARMRDEAQARREIEEERARLEKERSQYQYALEQLKRTGTAEEIERTAAILYAIEQSLAGVEARAANIRAGFVYVISNVGSFGPGVIKIGMTRRLDPMDRVRELGDASVPFGYDVHATIFSHDAVGLENALHRRFTDQRVNRVNLRREFFYASPAEVRAALVELDGALLEFTEQPTADQWHQSENERRRLGLTSAGRIQPPQSFFPPPPMPSVTAQH